MIGGITEAITDNILGFLGSEHWGISLENLESALLAMDSRIISFVIRTITRGFGVRGFFY